MLTFIQHNWDVSAPLGFSIRFVAIVCWRQGVRAPLPPRARALVSIIVFAIIIWLDFVLCRVAALQGQGKKVFGRELRLSQLVAVS